MSNSIWHLISPEQSAVFSKRHAAALEIVRTSLPAVHSRRAVDENGTSNAGHPIEIWRDHGARVAFVWLIDASEPSKPPVRSRAVGFITLSDESGIRLEDAAPDEHATQVFADCEVVNFSRQFWSPSASPAVAETTPAFEQVAVNTASGAASSGADAPAATPGGEKRTELIQAAQKHIDDQLPEAVAKHHPALSVDCSWETIASQPRDPWKRVDSASSLEALARALSRAGVINFSLEVNHPGVTVLERATPFYARCRLYRVIDHRGPRSRFATFVLSDSGELCALHSLAQPIHDFNEARAHAGELRITADTVAAYLRFFCEFTHGDDGAFFIVEDKSDLRWLTRQDERQELESTQNLFDAVISSVRIYRALPQETSTACAALERHYLRAFVAYGRNVFVAGFAVSTDGTLEMFADKGTHEGDLPIEPVSYNSEFQFRLRLSRERG